MCLALLRSYILGKAEGEGELWHGHVTAVTVGPDFRRQNLAQKLMAVGGRGKSDEGGIVYDYT